jgi:hypothetical protein
MPACRFSWDLVDDRTVAAFAADLSSGGPRPTLAVAEASVIAGLSFGF